MVEVEAAHFLATDVDFNAAANSNFHNFTHFTTTSKMRWCDDLTAEDTVYGQGRS